MLSHAAEAAALNERLERIAAENEDKIKILGASYKSTIDSLKMKFKKLEEAKVGEFADAEAKCAAREKELQDRVNQLTRQNQVLTDAVKSKSREAEENRRASVRRPSFVPERRVSLPSANSIASSVQSDPVDIQDSFKFDLSMLDNNDGLSMEDIDVDNEVDEESEDEDEDEDEEESGSSEEEEGGASDTRDELGGIDEEFALYRGAKEKKKKPKKEKKTNKVKNAKKVSAPAPTVSIRGKVALKLAAMTAEITALTDVNSAREADMKVMQSDIDKLLVELKFQKR
jgi:hypothetical protein